MNRHNVIGIVSALSCVLCCCLSLHGASLQSLSTTSDAVIAGTVTTRLESRTAVSFDISVLKVFKGNITQSVVHVNHAWSGTLGDVVEKLDAVFKGVWFLKRAGANWDVVLTSHDDGVGSFFLPLGPNFPNTFYGNLTGDSSLVNQLSLYVADGIESRGAGPEEVLNVLKDADPTFEGVVFSRFSASPALDYCSVGLAGQLTIMMPNAIPQLVQYWPSIMNEPKRAFVISALRDSWRDPTPDSVKQVISFINAIGASSDLRPAAIRAISAVHTKETMPFLAALLTSSDTEDRMRAVFGISAFVNGAPAQTPENTKSMEYLQFTQPASSRTKDTIENFAFRRGSIDEESQLVAFWIDWVNNHKPVLGL